MNKKVKVTFCGDTGCTVKTYRKNKDDKLVLVSQTRVDSRQSEDYIAGAIQNQDDYIIEKYYK